MSDSKPRAAQFSPAEPKAPKSKLRVAPSARRAAALRFAEGWSKSAVARELHIDWETAKRIADDPETEDFIASLKQSKPNAAVSPAPQTAPSAPTPSEQYKIPLDRVPLETRRSLYWNIQRGIVSRDTLSEEVLAAVDEYQPNVHAAPRPDPKPEPSRPPVRRGNGRDLQQIVDMLEGKGSSCYDSGRRKFSSVPPRLRPMPKLDFWD